MDAAAIQNLLGELRPTLVRIARLQLRNDTWADDVVSETLLAALESAGSFAQKSQVKTWVVGILKHKIIDQFRRVQREVSADAEMEAAEVDDLEDLYDPGGHKANPPLDWGDPHACLERTEFFEILQKCVDNLPAGLGRIFMMREWLEYDTEQICKEMAITSTNCFVMLHRARMRLRECLEMNWFAAGKSP